MTLLYHGTPRSNEASIDKRGICPRFKRGIYAGVYATDRLDDAVPYVLMPLFTDTRNSDSTEGIIYRIDRLSKRCKVSEATQSVARDHTFRIHGCGCVKPQLKCRVPLNAKTPFKCEWEEVK